jgi:hypothetical protein
MVLYTLRSKVSRKQALQSLSPEYLLTTAT